MVELHPDQRRLLPEVVRLRPLDPGRFVHCRVTTHVDSRRRHRARAGRGHRTCARRHRRQDQLGRAGGGRRRDGALRARRCPSRARVHPAHQGGAQGPDHDARSATASAASTFTCARRWVCSPACALQDLPGRPTGFDGIDLVIVRENTEDLYAGIEFEAGQARDGRADRLHQQPARTRRSSARRGHHDQVDQRHRHAADRAIRLRLRPQARPQEGDRWSTRRTS